MKKDNCIFCKIIGGEIPSHVLYEDEQFKVILDVNPATKGEKKKNQRNKNTKI